MQGREIRRPPKLDFGGISEGDLQTAIELFTPVYQVFLTDNDFWRATNLLQLDETSALCAARILGQPHQLVLLNNRHPMVPQSTLRAGYRLVLHGLASGMLYEVVVRAKRTQAKATR